MRGFGFWLVWCAIRGGGWLQSHVSMVGQPSRQVAWDALLMSAPPATLTSCYKACSCCAARSAGPALISRGTAEQLGLLGTKVFMELAEGSDCVLTAAVTDDASLVADGQLAATVRCALVVVVLLCCICTLCVHVPGVALPGTPPVGCMGGLAQGLSPAPLCWLLRLKCRRCISTTCTWDPASVRSSGQHKVWLFCPGIGMAGRCASQAVARCSLNQPQPCCHCSNLQRCFAYPSGPPTVHCRVFAPPVGEDTPFELVDVELEVALLSRAEDGEGPVQVTTGAGEGGRAWAGLRRRGGFAGEKNAAFSRWQGS